MRACSLAPGMVESLALMWVEPPVLFPTVHGACCPRTYNEGRGVKMAAQHPLAVWEIVAIDSGGGVSFCLVFGSAVR